MVYMERHVIRREKQSVRFRTGRRIPAILACVVVLLTGWFFFGAQTASAVTCHVEVQPEQAEVGQDVTVTVDFNGDNVGRVRAILEYDRSVLSYQGEEGDTGAVSLYMAGSGDGIHYSLPFKAAGVGSSSLTITPLDAYDMDEMAVSLPDTQSTSITVQESANQDVQPADPQKQESQQDVKEDTKEDPAAAHGKTDNANKEAPRSNMSVYILLGAAALFMVLLIAVLATRKRKKADN